MRIVCLPGDGIGPEVMAEAARAISVLLPEARVEEHLLGAEAIDQLGDPLPDATLEACREADAVLLGAVGSDRYSWRDGPNPEDGLFRLRRELDVYANLRPSIANGVDLMIVRGLVGGLYFGSRGVDPDGTVFDRLEYHPLQVTRIARRGFELAAQRDGRLLSVVVMVVGVALFLRLVQTVFRPNKVRYTCPDCGLTLHEPDAVHCKHCGRVINNETEGSA